MELKVGDILYQASITSNQIDDKRQLIWTYFKIKEIILGTCTYYKITRINLDSNEELFEPMLVKQGLTECCGFPTIALAIKDLNRRILRELSDRKETIRNQENKVRELEADLNFLSIKTEQKLLNDYAQEELRYMLIRNDTFLEGN